MSRYKFYFVVNLMALGLVSLSPAEAALITQVGAGGAIPDGDPSGVSFDITITDPGTIGTSGNNVSISLIDLSHTWVGDLAVTLEHVGFGSAQYVFHRISSSLGNGCTAGSIPNSCVNLGGSGFTYTFNSGAGTSLDQAAASLTNAGNIPGGIYFPTLPDDVTNSNLSSFWNDQAVAGTWRLFVADHVGADTSNSGWTWQLDIQTIDAAAPEPTSLALIGIGLAGFGYRRQRSQIAV